MRCGGIMNYVKIVKCIGIVDSDRFVKCTEIVNHVEISIVA